MPRRDWLNLVKTPSARSKIRAYFNQVSRSDDLQVGRDRLMLELRKHGLGISNAQSMRAMRHVAQNAGYKDVDDMLVALGTGKESAQHVANRMLKILSEDGNDTQTASSSLANRAGTTGKLPPMITEVNRNRSRSSHSSSGIIVKGADGVLVRLSRCCNPVPGDEILGFITRGRGVSVHRADCPNAVALKEHPERIIDVAWDSQGTETVYKAEVFIEALDRMNLLRDVAQVLSESGANVLSSTTASHRDGMVEMRFLFQVGDVDAIETIISKTRAVEGIFEAHRMLPGEHAHRKK